VTEGRATPIISLGGSLMSAVGPALVLGALGYYFGWQRTQALYTYFGFDSSLLGFSTQDYVFRSVEALWTLLTAVAVTGVVLVLIHWIAMSRYQERRWLRNGGYLLSGLGLCALALAVAGLNDVILKHTELTAPILLCAAAISGAYGVFLISLPAPEDSQKRGSRAAAEPVPRALEVFVLFVGVLGLFWLTSNWAAIDGVGAAHRIEQGLTARPEVLVYSRTDLGLDGSGASVTALTSSRQDDYRYRYGHMRLLIESGGRFFILPDSWRHGDGTAIILADDSNVRIEIVEH
jgi:hypothetical protein